MTISKKSLANLKAGNNKKWKHTPTVAIRVPEIFAEELLEMARKLDELTASTPEETAVQQKKTAKYKIEIIGEKICVSFPYDEDEVEKVKTIEPRGTFDWSDKTWDFPRSAASALLENFGHYDYIDPKIPLIVIEQQKQALIESIAKTKQAKIRAQEITKLISNANLDDPLPCGWTLFNHQKEAIEWLLAHKQGGIYRGGILADHMGLGKTISALAAAKVLSKASDNAPILVVCPSSLRSNWAREAQKVEVPIETFSWAKMPKPPESQQFILIADEAHYAQNPKAARTKNLTALAQSENCLATWLLTGTPIKNGRPINLLPLLKAISHPLAKDEKLYERRYCDGNFLEIGKKAVWDNSGASNLDELAEKTKDGILRRTKSDCLDLPAKRRILIPARIEAKEEKAYRGEITNLAKEYRDRVKRGEVSPDAEALVTLGNMRRVGSKYKVNFAAQQAEELLEQGQQVVIFTEYRESAKLLYGRFEGANAQLLTGETPPGKRQGIVDRFQSGESKVFIGTIKAGGVGITLTASNNVILVDRPWTPGDAEQAEDRCHRIGQENSTTAYWLQLGQIDQAIDSLLESKQKHIELVLKGKRKTLKGINNPKELAKQLLQVL